MLFIGGFMSFSDVFRIDYHNWPLVAFYVALLTVFLFGILRPRSRSEWRSAGVAQAFIIALYAEMYGLPLTMYFLAWGNGRSEFVQDHFHGHAWAYLMGLGDQGAIVFDLMGQTLIVIGVALAMIGWRQVHRAKGGIVREGLYRRIRHPQYTGFFLFLTGSLLNWPTLPTLIMFPLLLWTYYRLAKSEERDAQAAYGDAYDSYRISTGMFLPKWPRAASP